MFWSSCVLNELCFKTGLNLLGFNFKTFYNKKTGIVALHFNYSTTNVNVHGPLFFFREMHISTGLHVLQGAPRQWPGAWRQSGLLGGLQKTVVYMYIYRPSPLCRRFRFQKLELEKTLHWLYRTYSVVFCSVQMLKWMVSGQWSSGLFETYIVCAMLSIVSILFPLMIGWKNQTQNKINTRHVDRSDHLNRCQKPDYSWNWQWLVYML